MESLLANYASSDDEEQQQQSHQSREDSSHEQALASNQSIEAPKISQPFSSLPKPKSSSCSSIFSSLPNPRSNHGVSAISGPNPKRVVRFKPPVNPFLSKSIDEDEDEEEEQRKRKPIKESTPSSGKSLFSILPAPKNSAGLGSGAALGSGGRSLVVIEADAAAGEAGGAQLGKNEIDENRDDFGNSGDYEGNWADGSSSTASEGLISGGDSTNWVGSNESSYGSYEGYHGNYEGSYGYGYYDGSTAVAAPVTGAPDGSVAGGGVAESVPRMPGKRGRDEIPMEIVEVKQDELMKNRPREDQVKSTGIAFGPAYQPVSTKGKPSKLHKRKHQIGSLYYDMKQKSTELAERRSKSFLTKAETQAKYGW